MKTNIGFSFFTAMLCAVLVSGCVMNRIDDEKRTILLRQSVDGVPITIAVQKGDQWSVRKQAGPLVFNVLSQMVIWAEDENGGIIDTLYITGADFKELRHGGKDRKGETFFRESFPVWASRMQQAGRKLPSKEKPYTDAVTSATPPASFTVQTRLKGAFRPFVLYAEVNKSGDTNEHYTDETNGWVGQPSLVYRTEITEADRSSRITMELAGHGGSLDDTPKIHQDMSGLDSALDQIHEITILVD
ncbi:MAG: hypothetical protein ACOCWH_03305 [Spirochaetota bacterium]